jgi:tetratricopeptide (TPR) repeat protein
MRALHDAYVRHAQYYLDVLWEADRLYKEGNAALERALKFFDQEWVNIAAAQGWIASHIYESDDAAKLCSEYPNAAVYLLSFRIPPRERLLWLRAALDAALLLNQREAIAWHTGNLGRVYRELGDTQRAADCFESVLMKSREVGDQNSELYCLSNLASVYSDTGRQQLSIDMLSHALTLAEKLGDLREVGGLLGKMGTAFSRLGEHGRALSLYKDQLTITKETGDVRSEAEAINNLGVCYLMFLQYPRALELLEQAATLYETLSDNQHLIATCNNIGLIYLNTGAYDQGVEIFERQLDLSRKWGNPYGEGRALYNKALCLDSLNRREEAMVCAMAALETFKSTSSPDLRAAQATLAQWRQK